MLQECQSGAPAKVGRADEAILQYLPSFGRATKITKLRVLPTEAAAVHVKAAALPVAAVT